jgi:hypothetical protein
VENFLSGEESRSLMQADSERCRAPEADGGSPPAKGSPHCRSSATFSRRKLGSETPNCKREESPTKIKKEGSIPF